MEAPIGNTFYTVVPQSVILWNDFVILFIAGLLLKNRIKIQYELLK